MQPDQGTVCSDNATSIDAAYLREQTVGIDSWITTPFGERLQVYADYTASGRALHFIERFMQSLLVPYANTHTEDDHTGRTMTQALHQAEDIIKRSVNAGAGGRMVACGTGATGAIEKLQQIVGVALPPATRANLAPAVSKESLEENGPVVFVGPYEHHSNEVTWRESLATVVSVNLSDDGGVDLAHLEALLKDSRYQGRMRIGSFSAASNVTGRLSPVHEIAALLHRYDALAVFDYAASAPYVAIDMNPPAGAHAGDATLDAVFISPHKFLGGPGSCGLLVFNERLYRRDLGPSVGGGGTVRYVGPEGHDFFDKIEEREKAGTPGTLQIIRAALAFQVKDAVSADTIHDREQAMLDRAFDRWRDHPLIDVLGHADPGKRIGIVSFNIKTRDGRTLHPRFVTTLLDDLFGIQSRAGCSCAGPYGHRLLDIDHDTSEIYRHWIGEGYDGIKPGWCRIGFHYAMDDLDVGYIIDAVAFVAEHGERFLDRYDFDMHTGAWTHHHGHRAQVSLALDQAIGCLAPERRALGRAVRQGHYRNFLHAARRLAAGPSVDRKPERPRIPAEAESLQFFVM